jgi:hypothetical protein
MENSENNSDTEKGMYRCILKFILMMKQLGKIWLSYPLVKFIWNYPSFLRVYVIFNDAKKLPTSGSAGSYQKYIFLQTLRHLKFITKN